MSTAKSPDELPAFARFFGMQKVPFGTDVPPEHLYRSPQLEEALSRLEFTANNGKFAVLTGGVGCGKSTALRCLKANLSEERFRVLYVSESNLTPRWLYTIQLEQLGITPHFYRNDAKRQFHEAMLTERRMHGRRVLMVIDEAHLIPMKHGYETLEEIRFLLNCDFDSGNPLSLILCGQCELWELLGRDSAKAITQRIDITCRMTPYDEGQVLSYVAAHLRYAGVSDTLFSSEALGIVSARSGGVPRIINKICTHALLYAAGSNASIITGDIVNKVIETELPQSMLGQQGA